MNNIYRNGEGCRDVTAGNKKGTEMSEEIIKVLDELAQRFGIGIDWTSQNVMPYIEEITKKIIRWEVTSSIIWMVIGVLMILSVFGWVKGVKYAKERSEEDIYSLWDFAYVAIIITMIFFIIIGIVIVITQTLDIAQIIVFPEKIIITYLRMLV